MPTFSRKEIRNLLIMGGAALLLGAGMALIGQLGLDREFGVPEYMVSLRNAGVTIVVLAVLANALTLYRKPNAT